MFPLIGLLFVIGYVILSRSGVLEDIASSLEKSRRFWPPRHPEEDFPPPADADSERRLEVFEDFIEGLDPNRDIDEE